MDDTIRTVPFRIMCIAPNPDTERSEKKGNEEITLPCDQLDLHVTVKKKRNEQKNPENYCENYAAVQAFLLGKTRVRRRAIKRTISSLEYSSSLYTPAVVEFGNILLKKVFKKNSK